MALTQCRECGGQVSTDARTCPHCGARQSSGKLGRGCAGFFVIGILIVIIAALGSQSSNDPPASPSCKSDWTKCADNAELVNNYSKMFDAQFDCKQAAIKQARYGTPIFPSLYFFSTFYKGNNYVTIGTAILIESDTQFQNGFGAMVHSQVNCTYDLRAKRVVSVDISAR
jgi:hypothetical protein